MNYRSWMLVTAAAALVLPLAGCLLAAGAAVGAGVVYGVSEDTVRVDVRGERDAVAATVEALLEERGEVTSTDRAAGRAEAGIGKSTVTTTVFAVGDFIRVRVKARRLAGAFPDLNLAQEIARDVRHAFP